MIPRKPGNLRVACLRVAVRHPPRGAGVPFNLRLPFNHALWHGFVLPGSVLQFFSVWLYVLPRS